MMIKHIVLFKFKQAAKEEGMMLPLKNSLEALNGVVPAIISIRADINVNPAEKWDMALEVVVENMDALTAYAQHPAHQEVFLQLLKPVIEDRACVDCSI